jgi:hypothetical protein
MAQKIEAKTERPLQHFWLQRFLAVDTTDSRLALMDNACFYDLLNVQPVGFSNLHSVRDASGVLADFGAHHVYRTWNVHLNPGNQLGAGKEYLICWATDGTLWAYDVAAQTNTQIGSNIDSANDVAQFDWTTALIVAKNGYWYWNGTGQIQPISNGPPATTVTLPDGSTATADSAPSGGNAIAVYQGMVWIAQGRQLLYSVPNNFVNFNTTAGGGWSGLTDSTLKSDVTALFAANGYLYLFGATSVDALSDVYYPVNPATGQQLATPSFTKLNLNAIVGTDQPQSIMAYQRLVLFANRMGIWMIYGSTIERISGFDPNNNYLSSIDGTWQYLSFDEVTGVAQATQSASGGQVMSNALLCAAFLVYRKGDPIFGTGPVMMMYQADMAGGKWWSADTDVGPLTYICTALVNNQPALFGFANNKLYQLFADPASAPAARLMTGLWDLQDPLTDKQAIRAGIRMMLAGNPDRVGVKVMMDTVKDSYPISLSLIGLPEWTNQPNQLAEWQTPGGTEVDWNIPNPPFLMYWGRAPQCWSPYIGFTVTTQPGTIFEVNSLSVDYKLAARWSNS